MTTRRRAWHDLPASALDRITTVLGARPREFRPAHGGFSVDGVVGIVSADRSGPRLFVKAVPGDHPATADYRFEGRVAAALPPGVPTPRLRLVQDADGWVLLGSDVVTGRVAREPWVDEELDAAMTALENTSRALAWPPSDVVVPTAAQRMAGRCTTWRAIAATGRCGPVSPALLGRWQRSNLARLADVEDHWSTLLHGGAGPEHDTLLHFDLRHDNCIVGPDGAVTLVDWGRACRGPAWVDLVCLLLESDLGDRDLESLFVRHDFGRAADPGAVDALLVALGSYWTHVAALPPPDGAETLTARREYSRQATMRWLARRWTP